VILTLNVCEGVSLSDSSRLLQTFVESQSGHVCLVAVQANICALFFSEVVGHLSVAEVRCAMDVQAEWVHEICEPTKGHRPWHRLSVDCHSCHHSVASDHK